MNEPKVVERGFPVHVLELARFYSIVLLGWAHWTLFELFGLLLRQTNHHGDGCVSPDSR